MTLFERIGADALRAVIVDFYDRIFRDVMIGYMFEGKDRPRLVDKEYELTARFLGGGGTYSGKGMREAHAELHIFGGHFDRRLQLLRNTLRDHAIDPEVGAAWVAHHEGMRDQVVGADC